MTSFGWKRKLGSVAKGVASVFSENNEGEENETSKDEDWLTCTKRPKVTAVEDAKSKCKRLKNEGIFLSENQRFWDALKKWDQAILIDPRDATLYEMKAQALMQVGENFSAVQAAETAVALDSTWWAAYQTLGRAQLGIGEVKMAVRSFSHAVHLNPADDDLRKEDLNWAVQLLKEKRRREGEHNDDCKPICSTDCSSDENKPLY